MNLSIEKPGTHQYQNTLAKPFTCIGVGLHSGLKITMTVLPGKANTGYCFVRKDVKDAPNEVMALWSTVRDTPLGTEIINRFDITVGGISHLLAALHICGVDNAVIVLSGPEVPIMDGSAQVFVQLIQGAGLKALTARKKAIVVKQKVCVELGDRTASLSPSMVPYIDCQFDPASGGFEVQRVKMPITRKHAARYLADARVFGFAPQILTLREFGFYLGATLKNMVFIHDAEVMNQGGLRYKDEFARNKALCAIGDLALGGGALVGRYEAQQADHEVNRRLLRKLFRDESAYKYVDYTTMDIASNG